MTVMKESEQDWEGERGHVDSELLKRHLDDLNEPLYYVAGPPDMVDAMSEMLADTGIGDEHIKAEQFSGY